MAKLVVQAPGEPVTELDLPPGLHHVGRSPASHFQINHPSVSSSHCQIAVLAEGATIKDLDSTNGTWIDGQRIEERPLLPGQRLRLGEVDAVFEPQAAPILGVRLATKPKAADSLVPIPPPVPKAAVRPVAAPPPQSFYHYIPGAFAYPFKDMGYIPLAIGSMIFLVLHVLPRMQRVADLLFFSGEDYGHGLWMFYLSAFGGGLFGLVFNGVCMGYFFLFMQNIIAASANGEERMPSYPMLENWWDDGFAPYLSLLVLLACCLAPAVLCRSYWGPDVQWLTFLLGILGLCYFFMALLAVTLSGNITAMGPQAVIPSICRLPVEYAVYCALFFLLTGATFCVDRGVLDWATGPVASPMILPRPNVVNHSVYQQLALEFLFLYVSAVEMRLLGLLYHTGRERLAWKA